MHWKHYWEVSWEKQFEMGCKWSNLTAVKTQLHSFRKAEHMRIRYHLIAHVKWGWLAYTNSTVRDMMMIRTVNECMNCGERYEFMVDHGSYTRKLSSCEIKAWKKNSGLNGIRTHDLCNTSAVLYQLSDQVIWELVTLWVYDIPVDGEGCKWCNSYFSLQFKYMIFHTFICILHPRHTSVFNFLQIFIQILGSPKAVASGKNHYLMVLGKHWIKCLIAIW